MRLPKKGEKGFTLIELLIVVAILGVLAAVVIPNVGRFIGRGEEEAKDTEFANVQSAVTAMMVDNELAAVPGVRTLAGANLTNNMAEYPLAVYNLYQMDVGGGVFVNYVATNQTAYWYGIDTLGTITQYDTATGP